MGVPAFYRWLSEKYPKVVQYVLQDRVQLAAESGSIRIPFDATRPNPSGLECDNLYIDMNGIIHPCSHPENGPQPSSEVEMYENICHYIDHLFRATRPRKLLFLAIDGVAPRAKMNQQRSRRFRSAQEAREQAELENEIKNELVEMGHQFDSKRGKQWDSNVITPGTPFMLNLSEHIQFYIRKRISEDKAWKNICVIFSDASIPGEGEHKIMDHIRRQRSHTHYNPNLVHVIHGLDADLIMLALATHEPHVYILREEILFGRRSAEHAIQYQNETGFTDAQRQLDELAGSMAMNLTENKHKPLIRLSIPVLREYLAAEFRICERVPFPNGPDFERLIDDIVFLCFFVGNDFLPHLPSLDIRDGALDFLFNVYKRILPLLGDYITNHGGEVNLSHVDVILGEVGAIEDYVFAMKHENELAVKKNKKEQSERDKLFDKLMNGKPREATSTADVDAVNARPRLIGRAARVLEQDEREQARPTKVGRTIEHFPIIGSNSVDLGHVSSPSIIRPEDLRTIPARVMSSEDNTRAAQQLKAIFTSVSTRKDLPSESTKASGKRKYDSLDPNDVSEMLEVIKEPSHSEMRPAHMDEESAYEKENENKSDIVDELDENDENDENEEGSNVADGTIEASSETFDHDESSRVLKSKVKEAKDKKLSEYATSVEDKVRLHEKGWKDRYYTDKCKADDVAENGGREHLFRSYIVGLCWVMKYYYDGCPSWKWFYPFHYAPFASDLRNIERFQKNCQFELGEPFMPVEQLMAVLPEDSSHALPEACRWLMSDSSSPIIDFYPKEILCDPNGKAMPWLWVVLLPFIDESRLLQALKPTMVNWTDKEKLCNIRGRNEGFVFFHSSHNVALLLSSDKFLDGSLTLDQYCDRKVFGKLHKLDKMKDWSVGDHIAMHRAYDQSMLGHNLSESVFDPIANNQAVCGVFSEPPSRSHKSVLIPGVMLPPPVLTEEDKRTRRPRLNGRGGTIANLGFVAQQQSHQIGYGSMNISSYERELAERTGRDNQMNQTGIRSWGSMEPTQKKFHSSPPIQLDTRPQMRVPFFPPQRYAPPPGFTAMSAPPQRMNTSSAAPPSRWVPPRIDSTGTDQRSPPRPSSSLPPPPRPPSHPTLPPTNSYHQSIQQNPHSSFSYSHRINKPPSQPPPGYYTSTPLHGANKFPTPHTQLQSSAKDSQNLAGVKLSESKLQSLRAQLAKTLQQNKHGST